MKIVISGKNIDIGDSLRAHTEKVVLSVVEKYFRSPVEATVIISKESYQIRCDISVHIGKGIVIRCHKFHDDPYIAVDTTMEKVGENLRRQKNRLRSHHQANHAKEESSFTQLVFASSDEDEGSSNASPAVIAEVSTPIESLNLHQALMYLDLSDRPFLMFRNKAKGDINIVFKRPDGNIGLIDPSLVKDA